MKTENEFTHRHLDDVIRIQAAIKSVHGVNYPLAVCAGMWDSYSDSYAAGWLYVPDSEKEICDTLQFEIKHIAPDEPVSNDKQSEEQIYTFTDMLEFGNLCLGYPNTDVKSAFKTWITTRKPLTK